MNILFDCVSLQKFVGGGSEYTLYFFDKLLERAKKGQINLYGVYSSEYNMDFYKKYVDGYDLELVDINKGGLNDFIKQNSIDTFYIGIPQRYYTYDLSDITCRIVVTCHDASEMVLLYDKKYASYARRSLEPHAHPKVQFVKEFIKYFVHYFIDKKYEKSIITKFKNLEKLFQKDNVHIVTVSNYSKYSLLYYFNGIANPIQVFTPPHKLLDANLENEIQNKELKSLIDNNKKYILMVSCTRFHKNAALLVDQWDQFNNMTNGEYYGVLVGNVSVNKKNIVQLPFLSTSDLEQAYKNAYAFVFASVAEGYGYPPMEAMKYGIPVACSNVTSMPEIYKDSVIYFSPYYREDLFRALLTIIQKHDEYKEKSLKKYKEIAKKQNKDAKALEEFILGNAPAKTLAQNGKKSVAISIITPVYNNQNYLLRCLNSIKDQTLKNFEVILVDDGSTDQSAKILDDFAKKDPRFKVYHKANEGVTKSRFYGVKRAKGEYIAWVDSDDYIDPTHLELLYNAIKKQNADICVCNFTKEDSSGSTKYYETIQDLANPLSSLIEKCSCRGCLWTKLARRTLYSQNVLFPEQEINCWEDIIITANLYYNAKKTVHIPIFTYHVNDLNKMSITRNKKNYENNTYDTINVVKYFASDKRFKDINLLSIKYKTKYYILLNNYMTQKKIPKDFYNLFLQKNDYKALADLLKIEHVKSGWRFIEFFLILANIKILAKPVHALFATIRNKRQ
ncbi:MAG: glycosyltransferase [Treponema sp.]|nr:glycosyltransferase [Treponema sp.]